MHISPKQAEKDALRTVANLMLASARTAPKARGIDNLKMLILTGKEKNMLANKMKKIGIRNEHHTFIRDAQNVKEADIIILIGTKVAPLNLKTCGLCGYKNCAENLKNNGICIFNISDLGIALGSAVSIASLHHVDNRIMYTAGYAAKEMKLLGNNVKVIFGIPLSIKGKNIFFDRK